jgi:hypothetical protein
VEERGFIEGIDLINDASFVVRAAASAPFILPRRA